MRKYTWEEWEQIVTLFSRGKLAPEEERALVLGEDVPGVELA